MPAHEAGVVVATEGIALLDQPIAGTTIDHRLEITADDSMKGPKGERDQFVYIVRDVEL